MPKSKDTGVNYDQRPFSSGPYKIASYDRGRKLVLVRNRYWKRGTDKVREAKPDRIVVDEGLSQSTIDQRLIADNGADQRAISLYSISPSSLPRILGNSQVKRRLISASGLCTRFLAMNTTKPPFNKLKVRRAMQYAVDKEAYRTAHGGDSVGDIAGTYLPPAMTGGKTTNYYHVPPNGDVGKAKELLKEAGEAGGFRTRLITTSSGQGQAEAEAIQQALAKVGIRVRIDAVASSVYYDTIGDTKKEDPLAFYGWCADFPSPTSFIPPVFDGRNITHKGNTVVSQYNDKGVDGAIDKATKDGTTSKWIAIDRRLMADSPMVPLIYDKLPLLRGSKVTGAFGNPIWEGEFDFATLGVK